LRRSTCDLLVFVDADTLVTEAAVHAAVLAMRGGATRGGSAIRFGRGQLDGLRPSVRIEGGGRASAELHCQDESDYLSVRW
jgi:hypothetical protein